MKTITLTFLLLLIAAGAWAQSLPPPLSHDELMRRIAEIRARTNQLAGARTNSTGFKPAQARAAQPAFPTPPVVPGGPAVGAKNPVVVPPVDAGANATDNTGNGGSDQEEMIPAKTIDFEGVDVNQVLDVYAQLVNRTLLRAALPNASIVLKTQTPLTKSEAIAALKAVLGMNGITLIDVPGDKFVKVVPAEGAAGAGATLDHSDSTNLPELGSYVTHVVQLEHIKPSEMMPIIQPFAKLQNSILPIDSNGILVLRDFAENVKRMLEMIAQIDVAVPAEYTNEVIPIKYAQAEDIAGALNSLGGSGGSTVSFGNNGNGSSISGLRSPGGGGGFGGGGGIGGGIGGAYGGGGAFGQNRTLGGATANGTPSSNNSFQSRLNNIIGRSGGAGGGGNGQDQIQVFGQAKIIADSRSNSLLIFATRQDMEHIKHVISQLDVLLAQVLIEAVIMDISLDKAWNLGVSAAQNPKNFSPSTPVIGGGGFNNGQPFANFLSSNANFFASGSNVTSSLGSGFSYFGNIGPTWDVALQAAASDSSASVIQRPRIQTSQAKQAQFFVGETVPYITSSYYGGVGYGNNSSYSQLSVGIELDITPFINPDGLVVMDINQEIDDIVSSTASNGDLAPTTSKRTLNSEIAVKDKDTIILGGFVKSQISKSRSGVPILEDIPVLGPLFSQRSSNKDREELLVLMRPTVLKTPDLAEVQTLQEEKRLPGISAAAAADTDYENQLIEAQRKAEKREFNKTGKHFGFYETGTNSVDTTQPPTTQSQPSVQPSTDAQIQAQQAFQQKLNSLNAGNTNGN